MAQINSKTSGTRDFEKADGFLNLSFVDADGNSWNLPKGLPLLDRQVVSHALLEAARAAGEKTTESGKPIPFGLELVGVVHLVVDVEDAPAPNLTPVAPVVATAES